jgi:hypothetical protein
MKKKTLILLLALVMSSFLPMAISNAQVSETNQSKKSKAEKEAEQSRSFSRIDSLVNRRQFVFKAEFNPGSDEVFVVVDSGYAEIQNGNRNNLEGRITKFEVKRNVKQKTLAVTIMMRGALSTGDVFLFIGSGGNGKATINSEFPGYFSFDGYIVDFENANIYEGGSHFVH